MGELRFPPPWRIVRLDVRVTSSKGEQRVLRMILDPGAASVTLDRQAALLLGYDLTGAPTRSISSAHDSQPGEAIRLAEVKAVDESAGDIEAVCTDLHPSLKVSGLLGNTFLRHFRLTLELAHGWLRLDPIESTPAKA